MLRRRRSMSRRMRGLTIIYGDTLRWPYGFAPSSSLHMSGGRGQVCTRVDPRDPERVTYWPPLAA